MWHTQNVVVENNVIDFNPSQLTTGPFAGTADTCASANTNDDTLCGYMGLFSYYGSLKAYPTASVSLAVSDQQNNVFKDNTYDGPIGFEAFNQGDQETWSQWSHGFTDSYSGDKFKPQERGKHVHLLTVTVGLGEKRPGQLRCLCLHPLFLPGPAWRPSSTGTVPSRSRIGRSVWP